VTQPLTPGTGGCDVEQEVKCGH